MNHKIMEDTISIIKQKLQSLQHERGVKILFACESGSRAWGFPSPGSYYDVRFIYAHHLEWYLSLNEHNDVIELPINRDLDINGWDVRKALCLLAKHNAVLFEWMQSPIVYSSNEAFEKEWNALAPSFFNPIAAMHHYLSMSKKYLEECTQGQQVKLKKYLYCLRTTLAASWIAKNSSIPPMELVNLMELVKDEKLLVENIREIIRLKATKEESYHHPKEKALEEFLFATIGHCEKVAPSLTGAKGDMTALNDLFIRSIRPHKHEH